ncbi:unnamed protein product [Penicillium bialowiezense]
MHKDKNLFCTIHGHPLIELHDEDAYWVTVPVFGGLLLGGPIDRDDTDNRTDDWAIEYVIDKIRNRKATTEVPIDRVERDDHEGIFDMAETIARHNLEDILAGKNHD